MKPTQARRTTWNTDTGPYALVPVWVLGAVRSNAALRVYVALVSFASWNDRGEYTCWPSKAAIGRRAGADGKPLGAEAVRAGLAELERLNIIAREQRVTAAGQGSNLYRIAVAVTPAEDEGAPSENGQAPSPQNQEGPLPAKAAPEVTQVERTNDLTSGPPTPVRVDGRDGPLDALCDVCGIEAGSPRVAEAAKVLNAPKVGLRRVAWDHEVARGARIGADRNLWELDLVALIRERAFMYRDVFGDDVECTPTALRKWWVDLPSRFRKKRAGGAQGALEVAREELRRIDGERGRAA